MRQIHVTFALALAMALTPSFLLASDREIAQQIGEVMRVSGAMRDYDLAIKYTDGTAWLRGTVASPEQAQTALSIAKASPHVNNVVNEMQVARGNAKTAAAPRRTKPQTSTASLQKAATRPVTRGPAPFAPSSLGGPQTLPVSQGGMPGMGGPSPASAYVPGTGGGVAPATYDQPYMPGYAWPSYASYPNYGALTYPKQYSPTAWPYIGPFYPYPQVPLGWRKVTLEWDDGWWMLDFKNR